MLDRDIFFAQNARPTVTPGANWQLGIFNFEYNFRALADLARGQALWGIFRVATAFNAVAANRWQPAAYIDSVAGFTNVASAGGVGFTVASAGTRLGAVGSASDGYPNTSLETVGKVFQIAIPPLNDLALAAADTNSLFTLGMNILVPAADWSAGGMDVFLSPYPWNPLPSSRASGF